MKTTWYQKSGKQIVVCILAVSLLMALVFAAAADEPLAIVTASLPGGTVGTEYLQTLEATGGDGEYTWELHDEYYGIPDGLDLEEDGTITGTPTEDGSFNFTVVLSDNSGGEASEEFIIVIAEADTSETDPDPDPNPNPDPDPTPSAPVITTTYLPGAVVGTAYSQTLAATGDEPITWSLRYGVLPTGLSLNEATGEISGTPSAASTFAFTVTATNEVGYVYSALEIVVTETVVAPVITTTSPLPPGTLGATYDIQLLATGTAGTWTVTGELPPGLELVADTGVIRGTPTGEPAIHTFTITVTNAAGYYSREFSITIDEFRGTPDITTETLASGIVGVAYTATLAATGVEPITWSVTGNLPAGLELNAETGVISGTPTAAGTSTFTVRATNPAGYDTQELSIEVLAAPTTTTVTTTTATETTTAAGGGGAGSGDDGSILAPKTGDLGRNATGAVIGGLLMVISGAAMFYFRKSKKSKV